MGAVTGRADRMNASHADLSRLVSLVLRHKPWLFELELGDDGWVDLDDVVAALRSAEPKWADVDAQMIEAMVETGAKRRHEIVDGRIRAIYGHSVPFRMSGAPGVPPDMLYHGTSPKAWESIRTSGLVPSGRQFVHLATDLEMAVEVGRRKSSTPVVLLVSAASAHAEGVAFWAAGRSC